MSDEELDQALAPKPVPADGKAKAELLRASQNRLPRAAPWPRTGLALLALTVGFTLGWYVKPPTVEVQVTQPEAGPEPVVGQTPPAPSEPAPEPPASHAEEEAPELVAIDPYKLEMAAELAEPDEAARLYQRLGDYYLQQANFRAASRCYRLHLAQLPMEPFAVSDEDSWLLIEIKSLKRMERIR